MEGEELNWDSFLASVAETDPSEVDFIRAIGNGSTGDLVYVTNDGKPMTQEDLHEAENDAKRRSDEAHS